MELNERDWENEQSRLDDVCKKIKKQLSEKNISLDEYKDDVLEIRRSMWDNTSHALTGEFDESVEILQYINQMKQDEKNHEITYMQIRKLEKMLESPYFARIDFIHDEYEDKEKVYIGMSSLIDNDTLDIIITEKCLLCEKENITLTCIADGEKISFISVTDLYSLLGNAIDNAIEAVLQFEDQDKRSIIRC
jgi:sensor histidine kinase regulating citrate/malate metabolism